MPASEPSSWAVSRRKVSPVEFRFWVGWVDVDEGGRGEVMETLGEQQRSQHRGENETCRSPPSEWTDRHKGDLKRLDEAPVRHIHTYMHLNSKRQERHRRETQKLWQNESDVIHRMKRETESNITVWLFIIHGTKLKNFIDSNPSQ